MTQDKKHLPQNQEERELLHHVVALIEESKKQVALTVNREVTLLYWRVGRVINQELLQEQRGGYGEQIVSSLASHLTKSYGRGWSKRHLWHCVRVADTFPEDQIVNALSTQLSWTHLRILAAMEDELKRVFYTELTIQERWSTRVLQKRMDSMLFERSALSRKPEDLLRQELTQHVEVSWSRDARFSLPGSLCAGLPGLKRCVQRAGPEVCNPDATAAIHY